MTGVTAHDPQQRARSARGGDRAREDVWSQASFFHSMIWRWFPSGSANVYTSKPKLSRQVRRRTDWQLFRSWLQRDLKPGTRPSLLSQTA